MLILLFFLNNFEHYAYSYINVKKLRKLADLKQQISQKIILLMQHIATMSLCC